MTSADRLLDQYVDCRHFRLGVPRGFVISPDGARVVYVRARRGETASCLWHFDVSDGIERVVVDPADVEGAAGAVPAAEELVMRERRRERTEGITAFATDDAVTVAAFVLAGRLVVARLGDSEVRVCDSAGQVFDPRPSPDGKHIAYVQGGALKVIAFDGTGDRAVAEPEHADASYGLAELAAAEDMKRTRGFWWSPDGDTLLVARVDEARVRRWYLADPLDPSVPPREVAYPVAGTPNPDVSLWMMGLDGRRTEVAWNREELEYVVSAGWHGRRPVIVVQDRSQRRLRVLEVDPDSGVTTTVREHKDRHWATPVPGSPVFTEDNTLVWAADQDGATRLFVGDTPVTPVNLQVREVIGADGGRVLFAASDEPSETRVWEWSRRGGARPITTEPGVWTGSTRGGADILYGRIMGRSGFRVDVRRGGKPVGEIDCVGRSPVIAPNVTMLAVGERAIRVAVVLPTGHTPADGKLPVVVDSYGGPDAQRVLSALDRYVLPQWFAEQGFAVVVADGRGSPGRGPDWSHAVAGDFAAPAVQDQVDALHGAAEATGCLDLSRVGIRGWSFAGYLAALAVLRRPDVFHAAVAGGALTDARLYAAYWMERYLGHPETSPDSYDRCSIIDEAHSLTRPLMLMHGMKDDNVFGAHVFRLSDALHSAHRPHTVVPLPTSSHFVTQRDIERQVCRMQADFLRDALRQPAGPAR